jgi:Tol biopolymer transport system component
MKNILTLVCLVLVAAATLDAQTTPKVAPTVDQILSLKRVGSPQISPDGRRVAYTLRETTWDENAYHTEIWLADSTTGDLRQLTNSKKSSQSPAWSPDGSKLAFASDRTDKRQIY